jgi:hypothetical protein
MCRCRRVLNDSAPAYRRDAPVVEALRRRFALVRSSISIQAGHCGAGLSFRERWYWEQFESDFTNRFVARLAGYSGRGGGGEKRTAGASSTQKSAPKGAYAEDFPRTLRTSRPADRQPRQTIFLKSLRGNMQRPSRK